MDALIEIMMFEESKLRRGAEENILKNVLMTLIALILNLIYAKIIILVIPFII